MSEATNMKSGNLATYSVKVGGQPIPETVQIVSIRVKNSVNKIPTASITVLDGDPSTGDFAVSSSITFVPGAAVIIEAGYDSGNAVIFRGIITAQSIRTNSHTGSRLEVECRDEAIKMTVGRKCLTFSKQKDSGIIASIIGNYGLSSSIEPTLTEWPQQVQYYVTDWDFIVARAEANGMIVNVVNGKVTVAKPDANTTSVATLGYGNGLLELSATLNATSQLANVTANAWDYSQQAVISGTADNSYAGPGNISSATLASVIGLPNYQLQTSAPLEVADLSSWSQAQMIKSEFSKIRGEAKFQGTNVVITSTYLTLQGLGDRFNGDHFVSAIEQDIAPGSWTTKASLGLSNTWFTAQPDVMAPSASGLLPGARGLLTGTVKQMYDDPDNQYRILVDVPMFDTSGTGIWARLANFYATSGAGAFFMPEVGDEVVLGFLNEDPRYPVILGSMYSDTKIKPERDLQPNKKNSRKAIVSKSHINLQFDDENIAFTIATPGGKTITLSDKDDTIIILDNNSNTIKMSATGIDILSDKNINIKSQQNVTINGNMGITITSSGGEVVTNAVNIKENAQAEFSAKGSIAAIVQGGTQLTLKGAMVMIN